MTDQNDTLLPKGKTINRLTRPQQRLIEDLLLQLKASGFKGFTGAADIATHASSRLGFIITAHNVEGAAEAVGVALPGTEAAAASDRHLLEEVAAFLDAMVVEDSAAFARAQAHWIAFRGVKKG